MLYALLDAAESCLALRQLQDLSFIQSVRTGVGVHPASSEMGTFTKGSFLGQNIRSVKLTTHLNI
jgi:hypothetical protein